MAKHRTHSIDFKRQVVQDYLAGETLQGLARRHDFSRNLIRIWVEKYQAGGLDEDTAAANLLESYEARIAALERLVGKQALELECDPACNGSDSISMQVGLKMPAFAGDLLWAASSTQPPWFRAA